MEIDPFKIGHDPRVRRNGKDGLPYKADELQPRSHLSPGPYTGGRADRIGPDSVQLRSPRLSEGPIRATRAPPVPPSLPSRGHHPSRNSPFRSTFRARIPSSMYIADNLVYLDLRKTGSTHITYLLDEMTDGRVVGNHYPPSSELLASSKTVVGSIRNPWEWYVSLWAFGCANQGGTYDSLTMKKGRLRGRGWSKHGLTALRFMLNDLFRDRAVWLDRYADADDPERFRRWLTRLLGGELRPTDHQLGNWSTIRDLAGLLTYEYLRLYCRYDGLNEGKSIAGYDDLVQYEESHFYVDEVIRTESLETNLIEALERSGYVLSADEEEAILDGGTHNVSSRRSTLSYYYDPHTVDLVRSSERLLIEKYQYSFPEDLAPAPRRDERGST